MMLEIVCCSVEDIRVAEAAGATQFELCAGIEVGGLTPSLALIRQARKATQQPIYSMVRPRPGNFAYSKSEIETMVEDAHIMAEEGLDGIVFGILTASDTLHSPAMSHVQSSAPSLEFICHRAFDHTPNLDRSCQELIALGFNRILLSGGTKSALEGASTLRSLNEKFGDRIQLLPGGGIRAHNAKEVLDSTGIARLHLAPFVGNSLDAEVIQEVRRELVDFIS